MNTCYIITSPVNILMSCDVSQELPTTSTTRASLPTGVLSTPETKDKVLGWRHPR
jgi:hypothetical protein